MTQPTKGSFRINENRPDYVIVDCGPDNDDVAEFFTADGATLISYDEALANARVFVAAPDLLAALRGMLEPYKAVSNLDLKRLEREGRVSLAEMNRVLISRAAIERATGGGT